ncbi:MAG TPA: hypothetical protein VFY04_05220 [Solirubrobacterales bacterium]|nr:hypothetical protein [Solirubrobacterales bacterium]
MRRRLLGCAATIALLAAGVSVAAAPEGPRLAVIRYTENPDRLELLTVDSSGAGPLRLTGGGRDSGPLPFPAAPLSWRPDGTEIAFNALVGRGRDRVPKLAIFLASADGRGVRRVAGTVGGVGPVFSPDGRTVAFTRIRSRAHRTVDGKVTNSGFTGASIWILDLLDGAQRRLTPWRNGLEYFASSFSPDGSTLLATRHDYRPTRKFKLVALNMASGGVYRFGRDGLLPVYSPDGSEIAFFRQMGALRASELFVLDVAGGALRRLTRTPKIDELFASWDPSGERLAYTRFPSSEAADEGLGTAVVQINADATCQMKLLSVRGAGFHVPAWQPGPGREAGRISC